MPETTTQLNLSQKVIEMLPQEYNGDITIQDGQILRGNGASLRGKITGENVYDCRIEDLTISGSQGRIEFRGLRHSLIKNVRFENTVHGLELLASKDRGVYHNTLEQIHVGRNGHGSLGGIEISTIDNGQRRANNNTLIGCSVRFSNYGYLLNGAVGTTLVNCESEKNEYGLHLSKTMNTTLSGGYFESNDQDIFMRETSHTRILGAALLSKLKLAGPGVGSTGDLYLLADADNPGQTTGNWADKFNINQLQNSWTSWKNYDRPSIVGYYGLKGESGYRLLVYNDGIIRWFTANGSEALIVPTEGGIDLRGNVTLNGKKIQTRLPPDGGTYRG